MHAQHVASNTVINDGVVGRGVCNRNAKTIIAANFGGFAGGSAVGRRKDSGVGVSAIATKEDATHAITKHLGLNAAYTDRRVEDVVMVCAADNLNAKTRVA